MFGGISRAWRRVSSEMAGILRQATNAAARTLRDDAHELRQGILRHQSADEQAGLTVGTNGPAVAEKRSTGQLHDPAINKTLITMAEKELGIDNLRRFPVPSDKSSWAVDFPGYDPPFVDVPRGNTRFRKEGDRPDPADPREIANFSSLEVSEVQRDPDRYPLNPRGRTGLRGRGMLDRWGPTQAADPVATRRNEGGDLEVLLIRRGDTGEWALPGGKVDPGEQPWETAGRELGEEAGLSGVDIDFSQSETLYSGYVPDTRETDNAWMESTVLHYHMSSDEAADVHIQAGSDADRAEFVPVDDGLYSNLFSNHADHVREAAARVQH